MEQVQLLHGRVERRSLVLVAIRLERDAGVQAAGPRLDVRRRHVVVRDANPFSCSQTPTDGAHFLVKLS